MMRKLSLPLVGLTLVFVALAPGAAAHTTVDTDDGRFFITVGNQNEPIMTYTKTGLDLIVVENVSGERGDEVPDLHRTLTVTIVAPNGEEMSMDLKTQHGATGRYEFVEPYILTQPGEYYAFVRGEIDGTQVDERVLVGSGPIPAYDESTFPDQVQTQKQLEERIAALEAELAQLRGDMQAQSDDTATQESPVASFMLVALLLVGILAMARRR